MGMTNLPRGELRSQDLICPMFVRVLRACHLQHTSSTLADINNRVSSVRLPGLSQLSSPQDDPAEEGLATSSRCCRRVLDTALYLRTVIVYRKHTSRGARRSFYPIRHRGLNYSSHSASISVSLIPVRCVKISRTSDKAIIVSGSRTCHIIRRK